MRIWFCIAVFILWWVVSAQAQRVVDCSKIDFGNTNVDEQFAEIAANYITQPTRNFVATQVTHKTNGVCPWGATSVNVSFTYVDKIASPTHEQVSIVIKDSTAPTLHNLPSSQNLPAQVQCLDEAMHIAMQQVPAHYGQLVTASDDCSQHPSITYSVTFTQATCINHGTLILQWTALDECGNAAHARLPIRVWDTQPPQIDMHKLSRYCIFGAASEKICPVTAVHRILSEYLVTDNCKTIAKHYKTNILHTLTYTCNTKGCTQATKQYNSTDCSTFDEGTLLRMQVAVQDACGNKIPQSIPLELFFVNSERTCKLYNLLGTAATAFHL